jgi:hypothetical protein
LPPTRVVDALADAGVDARRRAQTLSLEEWAEVTEALSAWVVKTQKQET